MLVACCPFCWVAWNMVSQCALRPRSVADTPISSLHEEFLRNSITFRADTLRFVFRCYDPEGHVFMGTDYPYDMAETDPVGFIRSAVTDENSQGKIFGENLSRVMGIL